MLEAGNLSSIQGMANFIFDSLAAFTEISKWGIVDLLTDLVSGHDTIKKHYA
jgi:hypothetical protein